jgi:outer membrane protein TolC
MKALLIAAAFVVGMQAATLDDVVETALTNNASLHAINAKIAASKEALALSTQFDNPVLSLAVNAIHLDDISNRSIERMQSSSVALKQKVPFFGKRNEKERAAQALNAGLFQQLEQAKAALASAVRAEAYTLWKLKALLEIETRNAALMRHNAELFQTYSATSSGAHMGIMAAELALSTSDLAQRRLNEAIEQQLAKLTYLTGSPVEQLDLDLTVNEFPDLQTWHAKLENNYALQASKELLNAKKADLSYAELQHYPDPTVGVSYFHREKFEEYVSLNLSIPLPVYGSEGHKEQIARSRLLEQQHNDADLLLKIERDFNKKAASLMGSYERYRILEEESLPKLEHMFELSGASITTGGDLERYIDLLGRKLQLERQRVNAIAEFHTAYASLRALTGEIQ